MKVLHVTPSFYPAHVYGGPTLSSYELCRHLAGLGAQVRVLTTDANGLNNRLEVETGKDVQLQGMDIRYCRRYMRHSVSPTLVRLLRSHVSWADVVHLYYVYSFPTFPTLWWCRMLKKSVIWSPLGALQRWQDSSRRTLKAAWDGLWYCLADRDRLTLHLASTQEQSETLARFPNLRSRVIPNGVEIPFDLHPRSQSSCLRLLFIGRLHPIKGIECLLEACAKLPTDRKLSWRLNIAGWGEETYVNHLKTQIRVLGLTEHVALLGAMLGEAKQRLFEESDVAIIPSYSESFGLVIAEALAHAVPVIASKGTPWDGVETKGCGLWVANDPESLAGAIRRISTMPLQEMGMRGREWMQKEFTWAAVAYRMLDLYHESSHAAVPDGC